MASTPAREQRAAVRFDTRLPIVLAGTAGETHDISAHGVSFDTGVQQRLGELVNFTLEFTHNGKRHRLLCEGKVVRVEPRGGRLRVAARLVTPLFDGVEQVSL